MNDKSTNSGDTSEIMNMNKEQAEAYSEFIDYMAELYREYSHLFDEDKENDQSNGNPKTS